MPGIHACAVRPMTVGRATYVSPRCEIDAPDRVARIGIVDVDVAQRLFAGNPLRGQCGNAAVDVGDRAGLRIEQCQS